MVPANFHIAVVDRSSDNILRNLFEHYLHDMAEWFEFDARRDGSYAYDTDPIWSAGVRVYFAYAGTIPIGFALVGSAEEWLGNLDAYDLKEFFVVRRYRRHGVGKVLAQHVWGSHRGDWLVRVYQGNAPALPFWRSTIASYAANGQCEKDHSVEGNLWSYFTFNNEKTPEYSAVNPIARGGP